MRQLTIRLLGPLEVDSFGRPLALPRGRVRALAVALALSAGQPVPVEILAERVWGGRLPVDARACLHTAVLRLRRVLGAETISSGVAGYRLAIEPDDVDAVRFERLLDDADNAPDPGTAPGLLCSALDLWRAEPFEQHISDWFTSCARPRLVDRYLAAVERRADLELGTGLTGEAVTKLRELTDRYPLRESLWLRLFRGLETLGRPAEALAAYESLRVRLAEELGVDPGTELRRAHAALLAGTTEPVRPAVAVPHQLPADVDDFAGRGPALRRLDELSWSASTGGVRLVVVHGPGGVGKTTLVVHWAHRLGKDFVDGQLFVNLRGYGPGAPVEPAAALVTLLAGLGVASDRIPEDLDARSALLRTSLAGRRVLVILDNARDAEQVRPLLPGAGSMVLVTSRNELRGLAARERAQGIALDVLPAADSTALLGERVKAHAVSHDEASLARLAELCGHLPLALTVAAERATRYPDSPLDDLVRQLEDEHARLDLLETGEDLSTNLRAVMSWSYRALDPDSARLFRLLGLYPRTDIGAAAAAALAGIGQPFAARLLDRLAEAHLLGSPRPGRYAMHDLIHAYAAERMTADDLPAERDTAVRRLFRWFARSATCASVAVWGDQAGDPVAGPGQLTFDDDRQAMTWFATEQHTLLAVITASVQLGLRDEVIQLVRAMSVYQDLSRVPVEIRPLQELALATARAAGDQHAEAQLLILLGRHHEQRGEFDRALSCFESAHALHRGIDDATGVCAALGNIGIIHRKLGNHSESITCLERAIRYAGRRDLHDRAAAALHTLAAVYREVGRLADAEAAVTESVRLWRMLGLPLRESMAVNTLGSVHLARGDHARATSCYREALQTFRDIGSKWWLAYALRNLGRAQQQAGDFAAARASWAEALQILDDIRAEDNAQLSRTELRVWHAELVAADA